MNVLIEIGVVFIFGMFGTFCRYFLLQNSKNGLLVANCLGIIVALIVPSTLTLFISGFCGSLTSFSAFIKQGYTDYKYIILSFFLFTLIILIKGLITVFY